MSSGIPPSDVDSKKLIALVGTDKLDGSELDNVKTGLTPPNKACEYFEHQYSVENIATPMRFDEDDNLQTELELEGLGFGVETLSSSLGSYRSSVMGYSSQLSKICLDDILPIINRDTCSSEQSEEVHQELKQEPVTKSDLKGHLSWISHHSWDAPSTSQTISFQNPRGCSSIGSIAKPKKQFICTNEACKRKFNRSDELNRHLRVHSGIKPYACEFCFKKFARTDHLKTHRRTHTGEKPFECEICQKTFARSDEKSRHVKTHTRGRGLSRISTAPEFEPGDSTNSETEKKGTGHRSSDGSITYQF